MSLRNCTQASTTQIGSGTIATREGFSSAAKTLAGQTRLSAEIASARYQPGSGRTWLIVNERHGTTGVQRPSQHLRAAG